jgi:hypothetical protein
MAIIYTYPTKATPADADLILISDSESNPANQTKQITVASIKGLTSGVTSIIAGTNVTISSTGASGTGDVTINSSGGSGPSTAMTTSTLGLGKLRYATGSTPAAETQSTTANRTYGVTANSSDQLVVNVPWTDTSGISFSGNTANGVATYSSATTANVSANLTFATNTLTLTDTLDIKGDGVNPGTLNLYCENTSTPHAVSILGPVHTGATPYSIRLPKEIATQTAYSSGGRVLESDASGALQWINTPTGGGISFSGSTASGIATYSSASTANVSSNLTIDNTNKKLNIGSIYSIQDDTGVFKIGSLSSTQAQESIEFHINGAQKVKVDPDGRLVASVGSAANPNLKLSTGNDGIYGTTNAVQIVTNGASKISVSDGQTADIQMNDLVEFGYGLKFGSSGDTLQSYEEGSWTPVMFGAGSPTVTATGQYVKIGRNVTVWFSLICTAGDQLANARISGLPFNGQGASVYGHNGGASLSVNTGNSASTVYVTGTSGGASTLDLKVFTSTTDYQYALGYWPNSQGNFTVRGTYTYKSQS